MAAPGHMGLEGDHLTLRVTDRDRDIAAVAARTQAIESHREATVGLVAPPALASSASAQLIRRRSLWRMTAMHSPQPEPRDGSFDWPHR